MKENTNEKRNTIEKCTVPCDRILKKVDLIMQIQQRFQLMSRIKKIKVRRMKVRMKVRVAGN